METRKSNRPNLTDIQYNTRVRTVKLIKDGLAQLNGTVAEAVSRLNSEQARPVHLANDIAGKNVGLGYLQAPENIECPNEAYAVQLAKLQQDLKQVERRALRLEQMSKEQV